MAAATIKATDKRTLPRVDLSLTTLGLGTAPMGGFGADVSAADARTTVDAAWDHGLRYFDTAPYYGYGKAEHRLGAALSERPRNEFVLSTKAGRLLTPRVNPQEPGDGWVNPLPFEQVYDYTGPAIERSFEDSLQRLGTDKIDILLIHDIGVVTHGDRSAHYWSQLVDGGGFKAIDRLRASGAVKAIGLGVNEWEIIAKVMNYLDLDVSLLAGRYTLLEQKSLSPFLDDCIKAGHAIVIGGPFNSGILAGGTTFNYERAPVEVVERVKALRAVCDEFGVALPAAALQFPLAHPAVVSCVPGGRTVAELEQNVALVETPIPAEFWAALKARGLLAEAAPVPGDA